MGGNEYQDGFSSFILRYYVNDGKGNFSKMIVQVPHVTGNLSCIKPADYDRDGDLDVFFGAPGRAQILGGGSPLRALGDGNR